MRKLIIFLNIFLFFWGLSSACTIEVTGVDTIDTIDTVDGEDDASTLHLEVKAWFDYLCSEELGGRYSGSAGIEKAVDFLVEVIGRSDSLEIDAFDTDKCMMKNIIFHVKGESDSLVVLGAHYDAYGYKINMPLPGADDNLSGVAVVLQVIKAIQRNTIYPFYSIDFCLFDGEEIGRYGSKRYLSKCEGAIALFINFDTCGGKDSDIGFFFSPLYPGLITRFTDFIDETNLHVYEYNPKGSTTDCEPFQKKDIPFVAIGCRPLPGYLHKKDDDVSHISFERLEGLAKGIEKHLRTL